MLKDINGCNNGTYHSSIVSQMDNLKHWREKKDYENFKLK